MSINKNKIDNYTNLYMNIITTFILIGVCFIGVLQPIMADDYTYVGQMHEQGFFTFFKNFYLTWCGRITNSIFMGFTSISNTVFILSGLLIGIFFILVVIFANTCALGRFPKIFGEDRFTFLLTFAAIWFGIPVLGECVFWRSGAGSYLIPMLLALFYIMPYTFWFYNQRNTNNIIFDILMFVLGVFVGSSQEQIFVSIFIFSFLWILYVKKNKLSNNVPRYLYIGIAGLILGGLILILAPGNFARFSTAEHRSLLFKAAALIGYFAIYYFIVPIQQLWIWIALILFLIFAAKIIENKEQKADTDLISHNDKVFLNNKSFKFWILIALSSVVPMFFLAASVSARTCFFFIIFLTIALISILKSHEKGIKIFSKSKLGTVILIIILNVVLIDVYIGVANNYLLSMEVKNREEIILAAKKEKTDIEVPPLNIQNFHTTYIYDVKIDPNHAVNKAISQYYKINSIKINHALQKYEVEESTDVVDSIKNYFREKLK